MELETRNLKHTVDLPAISVIVPVYNAEKTIRQCVDSILSQDYRDFELLLIDDGSKDSSPAICDEYASKDDRVKSFHKENAGVSAARNKGLENARGEWITFIDSDDYISEYYFHGVKCCKQELLITGFRDEIGGNVYENVKMVSDLYQNADDVTQFIRSQVSSNMVLRGPWGKFYRRELLEAIRFNTEMKLGEDTCFVFDYLAKCKTIEVNVSSFYVIRRGTIPDAVKYQSSVEYAVRSLNYVWESFRNMEKVHQFGRGCFYNFIGYYKMMCKHEWKNHWALWYRNPKVYAMYKYTSHEIPISILVKYHFVRFFSNVVFIMKKILICLINSFTIFLIKMRLLSPLVIVRMDGGVASQMHFYLVGMLFREKGYKVKFDLSWYKTDGHDLDGKHVRNFDLLKAFPYLEFEEISIWESVLFAGFKYVNHDKSMDFIKMEPPLWLLSYYPYTTYMLDEMMQHYFKITPSSFDKSNILIYDEIKAKTCPVAIHVRRGDLSSFNPAYGNPVPNSYFANAIGYIIEHNTDPFFYFFSDDTQWVRDVLIPNLRLSDNYSIVEGNGDDKGYIDMFLIATCKCQITSKGSLGKYGGFIHSGNDNTIIIYDDIIEQDKWGGLSDRLVFIS